MFRFPIVSIFLWNWTMSFEVVEELFDSVYLVSMEGFVMQGVFLRKSDLWLLSIWKIDPIIKYV